MDAEYLLGSILKSVFTSRRGRKRTKGAMRYVLGNPRAAGMGAMALGGLAYALYQELTKGGAMTAGTPAPATPPHATPVGPPPLPGASASPTSVVPPPLPTGAGGGAIGGPVTATTPWAGGAAVADVPAEILRVIRLSLSAARADGTLTAAEQDAILGQARQVGAEPLIGDDLRQPRPLRDIVAGVQDVTQRERLYTIAFAIVRADETVSEQERSYLDELAALLGLDTQVRDRLERDAVRSITRAASAPDEAS